MEVKKISLWEASSKYWWGKNVELRKLFIENGSVLVNRKVVKNIDENVPVNARIIFTLKRPDLSVDGYTLHVSRIRKRGNKFRVRLDCNRNGRKNIKLIKIENLSTSQKIFKNKQDFKRFYDIKVKDIKKWKRKNYNLTLLEYLECRLDVLLFRSGLCSSLKESRDLIKSGVISVNNSIIKHCSYILSPGSIIRSLNNKGSLNFVKYQQLTNVVQKRFKPTHIRENKANKWVSSTYNYKTFRYPMLGKNNYYKYIGWNEVLFIRGPKFKDISLPRSINTSLLNNL